MEQHLDKTAPSAQSATAGQRLFEEAYGAPGSKSLLPVKNPDKAPDKAPAETETENENVEKATSGKSDSDTVSPGMAGRNAIEPPVGAPGTDLPSLEIVDDTWPKVKTLKGGTVVTKNEDGSEEFKYADGSSFSRDMFGNETRTEKDGFSTTTYKDGSKCFKRPDGSETTMYASGVRVEKTADGTQTNFNPDGNVRRTYPDGSHVDWDTDGNVSVSDGEVTTTQKKDGTFVHEKDNYRFTETTDGNLTMQYVDEDDDYEGEAVVLKRESLNDGTVEWKNEDGTIRLYKTADGSIGQEFRDGDDFHMSSITKPDGSSVQMHADGTKVSNYADGTSEIEFPKGEDTVSMKVNKDSSVDIVKADGSHEHLNRDGSFEITRRDGTVEKGSLHVTLEDGSEAGVSASGEEPEATRADGSKLKVEVDEYGNVTARVKDGEDNGKPVKVAMSKADIERFEILEESKGFKKAYVKPQALEVFGAKQPMLAGR
jgi:hypothetical protein